MKAEDLLKNIDNAFLKRKTGSSMDERMSRLYALKGYTLESGRALRFLYTNQEKDTLGEIASCLDISKSQITKIIDRFEADGLVVREKDRTDRRVQHAVLTGEGRQKASELEEYCQDFHKTVMTYLPLEEMETYFRVKKLISAQMWNQLREYEENGAFRAKQEQKQE